MHIVTKPKKNSGLFMANYEIRSRENKDAKVYLCLTFYLGRETVIGNADINKKGKQFVSIPTYLKGDFTYFQLNNQTNKQILVTADGFLTPDQSTFISPNAKIRMLLNEDWEQGIANIKYQDSDGSWKKLENAQITLVPGD